MMLVVWSMGKERVMKKKYKRKNYNSKYLLVCEMTEKLQQYGSIYGIDEMLIVLMDVISHSRLRDSVLSRLSSENHFEMCRDKMREINKESYLEDGEWEMYRDKPIT